MLKRKVFACILSVLLIIVFAVGCGGNGADSSQSATGQNETDKVTKDTLIVAIDTDADTLDPMDAIQDNALRVINNIYDTLIDCSTKGDITPRLAEKWDISQDGLAYTFYLKKGVKFQNGEELKAADVKYSIERAVTAPVSQSYVASVKDVEVVDDYTAKINLKTPEPYFLQNLSTGNLSIVNEKAVTAGGKDYGRNPVGTGAYKLSSWSSGDKIVLERFDGCWRGKVALKTVTLRIFADALSKTIALQNGEVDVITSAATSDIATLKSDPNLVFEDTASPITRYLGMNVTQKPFDNKLVRQAVSYAIDKNAIIQGIDGQGVEAKSMILPEVEGSTDISYPCDIQKAKELLAQAGYPNGFDTELNVLPQFANIAPLIQDQLSKIGINANINQVDANAFFQNLAANKIFFMTCAAIVPNPDILYYSTFHSSSIGVTNSTYTNSKDIDNLLDAAKHEMDQAKRVNLYVQFQTMLKDEAPIVPLFNKISTMAYKKGIKGLEIDPINMYNFYKVSW